MRVTINFFLILKQYKAKKMKTLLTLWFVIIVIKVQSQTNTFTLRESIFNISIVNKNGKEFYYRSEDRHIFSGEYIITTKKKDNANSSAIHLIGKIKGLKEKGAFNEGYKNGTWNTLYKNKVVKTERWNNGLIFGRYQVFNTKGKSLYEVVFIGNSAIKYKDYYYHSGKLKVEGNCVNGKKEGEWKYYAENGKTIKTINYKQGVPYN